MSDIVRELWIWRAGWQLTLFEAGYSRADASAWIDRHLMALWAKDYNFQNRAPKTTDQSVEFCATG